MKLFEVPEMKKVVFAAKDILTVSSTEPTEKPKPSDFTTPEDEFDD